MAIAKQNNMEDKLQAQFEAIFPNGDVKGFAEQQNTFNFDAIVAAISAAPATASSRIR